MYDVTKIDCCYDLFRATSLFRPPARVTALSFRPALLRKQRDPDVKQVDQGRDGFTLLPGQGLQTQQQQIKLLQQS